MYVTYFEVTGTGNFPFDMLRYDTCFPARQEDTARFLEPERDKGAMKKFKSQRSIRLCALSHNPKWSPTFQRWASFGWGVTRVEATKKAA
jgi:hypothetical protein